MKIYQLSTYIGKVFIEEVGLSSLEKVDFLVGTKEELDQLNGLLLIRGLTPVHTNIKLLDFSAVAFTFNDSKIFLTDSSLSNHSALIDKNLIRLSSKSTSKGTVLSDLPNRVNKNAVQSKSKERSPQKKTRRGHANVSL